MWEVLRKAKRAAFSATEVSPDIAVGRDLLPLEGIPDQVPEAVRQLRNLNGEFYDLAKDLPGFLHRYAMSTELLAGDATSD